MLNMSPFRRYLRHRCLLVRNPVYSLKLLLSILLFGGFVGLFRRGYEPEYRKLHDSDIQTDDSPSVCVRPNLELWHPSMKEHFEIPPALHCEAPQDWVFVQDGKIRIASHITIGDVSCECTPVISINQRASALTCSDGQDIPSDAFEIKCTSKLGDVYKNIHLGIKAKTTAANRLKSDNPNSIGLNILMIGFDTVSRLNWIRTLPKSYEYFSSILGGITLEGYNIVGDGTPPSLLGILTGKREEELSESRKGFAGATFIDDYPWIWRELNKNGYVTQFGEDDTVVGTFEYRLMGFDKDPVDHFLRPYRYIVEHNYQNWLYRYIMQYQYRAKVAKLCLGSEPQFDTMLNWIKELYVAYPATPKFSFLFHNEYSHDSYIDLMLADETLLAFLTDMKESGHLDNTLLILMSDHGPRYSFTRNSQQGKYEERLPYMGLRLPEWFATKYPKAMSNLRDNVQTLTTPFDIHATFLDVINYKDQGKFTKMERGISLFQAIPKNRKCSDADVAPHWCTCMDWTEASVHDNHVISAANELLKTINALLWDHKTLCEELTLDHIESAVIFSPKVKLLKFQGSLDADGRLAKMTNKMLPTQEMYQITIIAKPSGAIYEATITYDQIKQQYSVDLGAVSRINKYGSQPRCVMDNLPHLRPYCYCRD